MERWRDSAPRCRIHQCGSINEGVFAYSFAGVDVLHLGRQTWFGTSVLGRLGHPFSFLQSGRLLGFANDPDVRFVDTSHSFSLLAALGLKLRGCRELTHEVCVGGVLLGRLYHTKRGQRQEEGQSIISISE